MPSRRRRAAAGVLVVLLASWAGAVWWWSHPPDPAGALRERWAPLAAVAVAARDSGRDAERWALVDARGDSLPALWRAAHAGRTARWTIVLLGGLQTGARAVDLVPDSLPINVLAVDWPWRGPRRMSGPEFLRELPRIREAILRSPAALALGVEAARRRAPDGRVALIGVSLGVPAAAAAMRLVRPDALVLIDGWAALDLQLAHELRRMLPAPLSVPFVTRPVAALAARLVDPLEPARHGDAALSVPTLILEAADDERIPAVCRERLRAAYPRGETRSHPRRHVHAKHGSSLAMIVSEAYEWLEAIPDGSPGRADSVAAGDS